MGERDLARKGEMVRITKESERIGELVEFQYKQIQGDMSRAITRTVKTQLKENGMGDGGGSGGNLSMEMVTEKIGGLLAQKADK